LPTPHWAPRLWRVLRSAVRLHRQYVADAATIRSVPTADFLGALAVRPDGVIFGGNGDDGELFTIDPLTGAETLVGSTGLNFVGALDFAVPEPATFLLFGSGLMAMAVFRRRRSQDI